MDAGVTVAAHSPSDAAPASLAGSMGARAGNFFGLPGGVPVFKPTDEEFSEPVKYIETLRKAAEKFGICKIVVPPSFRPPFAADTETLRFAPKSKEPFPSLSEDVPEGTAGEERGPTSSKYLDAIRLFHQEQDPALQLPPRIRGNEIDLYSLNRAVERRGGPSEVSASKAWAQVGREIGLDSRLLGPVALQIKTTYLRYIQPFAATGLFPVEEFARKPDRTSNENVDVPAPEDDKVNLQVTVTPSNEEAAENQDNLERHSTTADAVSLQGSVAGDQEGANSVVAEGTVDEAEEVGTPEASAREAEASGDDAEERRPTRQQRQRRAPKRLAEPEDEPKPRKKAKAADSSAIPLEDHCIICASARDPTKLLICDGCERVFHLYCLTPPLAKVPRGKWFCPDCHRAKYPTPAYERSAFGMTLQEFQEEATKFQNHVLSDTTTNVEVEFWRRVENGDYLSSVGKRFYHELDMPVPGTTAFPTIERNPWEAYTSCPWNLNNLPVAPSSMFSCLSRDIPSFIDSRVSFGHLFNSRPWRFENYFAPALSYLHTGQPRTWYCIPPASTMDFSSMCERLVGQEEPRSSGVFPWIDPQTIREANIPVYSVDQQPHEFVLVFAKGTYCYFDHGFNVVETVNVAPPSWLSSALEFQELCVADRVRPPFSLEELAIRAAQDMSTDFDRCVMLLDILQKIEDREKQQITDFKTVFPELASTPSKLDVGADVVCGECQQHCIFSYVSCDCEEHPVRCLRHFDTVCGASPPHEPMLVHRSPLSKLKYLIERVNKIASKPAEWLTRARTLLREHARPPFRALQQLFEAAEKLPSIPPQAESLRQYLVVAETWVDKATKVLDAGKKRLKKLAAAELDEDNRSTIAEVQGLLREAEVLGIETPEIKSLDVILGHALEYQDRVREVLAHSIEPEDARQRANDLLDLGATLDIHVEEFDVLEKRLAELEWWQNASELVVKEYVELDEVCDMTEDGRDIGIKSDEPLYARLRKMRTAGDQWRIDALKVVKSKLIKMDELRVLDARTKGTPSVKELRNTIRDLIGKVDDWRSRARNILGAAGIDLPPLDADGIDKKSQSRWRTDSDVEDESEQSEREGSTPVERPATPGEPEESRNATAAKAKNDEPEVPRRTVYAGEARSLLAEMNDCPVKPPEIAVLREELREVEEWTNRAKRVFAKREKGLKESLDEIHVNLINGVGNGEGLFCICRTADEGFMIECDVCREWYHGKCVRLSQKDAKRHSNYICPVCDVNLPLHREKRPSYQEMVKLAEAAENLPLVPDEKETVDTIVDLVNSWVSRLKSFLSKTDDDMRRDGGKTLKDMLRVSEGMRLDFGEFSDVLRSKVAALIPLPDEDTGKVFCLCSKPYDPVTDVDMMECDNCKDWFHFGCVGLTPEHAADIAAKEEQWLCPNCDGDASKVPERLRQFIGRPRAALAASASSPQRQMMLLHDVPLQVMEDAEPKAHGPLSELMALYLYFSKYPSSVGATLEETMMEQQPIPDTLHSAEGGVAEEAPEALGSPEATTM